MIHIQIATSCSLVVLAWNLFMYISRWERKFHCIYTVVKDWCAWYNARCYETGKRKVVPWGTVLFDVVKYLYSNLFCAYVFHPSLPKVVIIQVIYKFLLINFLIISSLWLNNAICKYRSVSTLVMACCLIAPSHYLNQCWFIIKGFLWYSPSIYNSNADFTQNVLIKGGPGSTDKYILLFLRECLYLHLKSLQGHMFGMNQIKMI